MTSEIYNIISSEYKRIKSKNPSYSLRAYAAKLQIPPSALSEILNGKRSITDKMAKRIVGRLNLSKSKQAILLELNSIKIEQLSEDLTLDYFRTISDWHYFATLSLAELSTFKDEA
jgi:plasmid maintenance system antidote protein VapI